jgi:hypothetical protein
MTDENRRMETGLEKGPKGEITGKIEQGKRRSHKPSCKRQPGLSRF